MARYVIDCCGLIAGSVCSPMTAEMPPTPRTFFVIQNDPIVSLDLVGMLGTYFPNGVTHLFDQLDAALELIETALETACVLIASDLVTTTAMTKIEDMVARGARIVVIGASDTGSFSANVSIPFSTKMILDVLA